MTKSMNFKLNEKMDLDKLTYLNRIDLSSLVDELKKTNFDYS